MIKNAWTDYCQYLKDWADSHRFTDYNTVPLGYDQFRYWIEYCQYLRDWADSHSNPVFEQCRYLCYKEYLDA